MSRLLAASIAPNSHKAYATGWNAFCRFRQPSLDTVGPPASAVEVRRFVAWLSLRGLAPATIANYVSGVGYFYKLHGMSDPTKDFLVSKLIEGSRRGCGLVDNRVPISLPILQQLIDSLPHICASQFESTMFKAVFLGAFFVFLRVGEFAVVSNSRVQESVLVFGDVQFSKPGSHDQFVGLTFRQSKNNQHGFPQRIRLVTTSSKSLCPVQGFLDFIAIRPEYPGPFFCHFDSSPLTRYQFNSVLRKAVFFAGLGGQQIRGHSFRIGAASSAAALGVSHDNIRAMGRWRSNAFLSYIRPIPTCNLQSGC
jgi:hypothetical protein